MGFAVIACGCSNAWAVDLRAKTSRCTACGRNQDIATRHRHWTGETAAEARTAAGRIRAALAQGIPLEDTALAESLILEDPRPASHDSPIDAAAAKGRDIRNLSDRAEEVALWMTRLEGPSSEPRLLEALVKAGLSSERAGKEITRMLACDVTYEPKAGFYASLSS